MTTMRLIVDRLNAMLAVDKEAMDTLVFTRFSCLPGLLRDAGVTQDHCDAASPPTFGLLGLLSGLVDPFGNQRVAFGWDALDSGDARGGWSFRLVELAPEYTIPGPSGAGRFDPSELGASS